MAGVRWGRGFFRVWIVFAIAWLVLGVGIGTGSMVDPYVSPRLAAVPAATGEVTLYPTYGTVADEVRTLVSEGKMKTTEVVEGFLFYTTTASSEEGVQRGIVKATAAVEKYLASARMNARVTAAVWIVMPPVVLLIIGWGIGWAISGFRRTA